MSEQFVIREVPKAGTVVSHAICRSGNVIRLGEIAKMALMETEETQEVSRGAGSGDRTLVAPSHGSNIVTERNHGAAGDVAQLG